MKRFAGLVLAILALAPMRARADQGPLSSGWSLVVGGDETVAAYVARNSCVAAIYSWEPGTQGYRGFFPLALDVPGASDLDPAETMNRWPAFWVYCEPAH